MSLCMVNPFLVEKYQETDLKRFFNKYSIATVLSKTFFRNSLVTSKTIKSTPSLLLFHYFFRAATVFCKNPFRDSLTTSKKWFRKYQKYSDQPR